MDYVLGTANLGLPYGQALVRELPDESRVGAILDAARAHGIGWLDTAAAYGQAEARIGRYLARTTGVGQLRISTKLSPALDGKLENAEQSVSAAVVASAELLGTPLDQLLVHRWTQYRASQGRIWSTLRTLRTDGHILRLGASVQSPDEVRDALAAPDVETIQLACNLLDWRYDTPDFASRLASRSARIEVRSVFLQGLLTLSDGVRFPRTTQHYDEEAIRRFLIEAAGELTGGNLVALCFRYATGLPWADAVVFGVDSPRQLDEVMAAVQAGPFPADVMAWLRARRPNVPAALLDPAQWL